MDEEKNRQRMDHSWNVYSEQFMGNLAELCRKVMPGSFQAGPDERGFYLSNDVENRRGILSIRAHRMEGQVVRLRVELLRSQDGVRVYARPFFHQLSRLGEKVRLCPPSEKSGSLSVELRIHASSMSISRASAFVEEMKVLDEIARTLQEETPRVETEGDLSNAFDGFRDSVRPVYAWPKEDLSDALQEWARKTIDYVISFHSLAVCAAYPIQGDAALSLLSRAGLEMGVCVGRLIQPTMGTKTLAELARKVHGTFAVPAMRLSFGNNVYEMGNEVQGLLHSLFFTGSPLIFTGNQDQLRFVFHGGQGGISDPLSPVVIHVPRIPLEMLVRSAVRDAARVMGGLSPRSEQEIISETVRYLQQERPSDRMRVLPAIANRTTYLWVRGKRNVACSTADYVRRVCSLSETLSGVPEKPRASRSELVQERYQEVFTDESLSTYLKEHLLAQDAALDQLTARLRMECLTRPLHQPLRYCAQGTPGTGKSESAILLAERLEIPYINIDAASIPDYYSAAAQLLGSGRGIVGSYQSGRLEQAAKHYKGALIEVSDLDHANERVRSGLADLFLQVLETGEAQSAAGAMFSCANLIFAFTLNLPNGADENVRKEFGFGEGPTSKQVRRRVVSEIKKMLSGAFLSRIGTPILFDPLDGESVVRILERSVLAAVHAAAERLSIPLGSVELEEGIGSALLASLPLNLRSFGARALLEHGRTLAAEALLEWTRGMEWEDYTSLRVTVDENKMRILPAVVSKMKNDGGKNETGISHP